MSEQIEVICTADLVNPAHPPVFASADPQMVNRETVEAFPSKFITGDEPEGDPELEAAIVYAAWEEAAVYAQSVEDEAAAVAETAAAEAAAKPAPTKAAAKKSAAAGKTEKRG